MFKLKPFIITATLISAAQLAYAAPPQELRDLTPQVPLEFDIPDILVNPTLEEPDVRIYRSGAHFSKTVVTSTKPRTTSSANFINLPGARTRVYVPPRSRVLVNTSFAAESRCSEPDSTQPNWCETRILVNGVEASPAASSFQPDTFAFDSTDAGTESSSSWEAHAMDRHTCVINHSPIGKYIPVQVQWKVTDFGSDGGPNFWLDDWSLKIELARGCRKYKINQLHING